MRLKHYMRTLNASDEILCPEVQINHRWIWLQELMLSVTNPMLDSH